MAAGSAALALVPTIPSPAKANQGVPDPILEAIEAHRALTDKLEGLLSAHTALEEEMPREKRQSRVDRWEEFIIFSDDHRWIDCEREVTRTWEAISDAEFALVNVQPTTQAGLLSLLRYALAQDTDGEAWNIELLADDGRKRHWYYFLIDNVVAALDPETSPQYPIL